MKRVGFFAGAWLPLGVLARKPNAHWCATVALTPGIASNCTIDGCVQDVAPAGCSWKQRLPAAPCCS